MAFLGPAIVIVTSLMGRSLAVSPCPDGFYGAGCSLPCGMCFRSPTTGLPSCDLDGYCTHGCIMWWVGYRCKTQIVRADYGGQSVTILQVGTTKATLQVEQLDVSPELSPYYGYLVVWKEYNYTAKHRPDASSFNATIYSLMPASTYHVRILPFRIQHGVRDYGRIYPTIVVNTRPTSLKDEVMLVSGLVGSGVVLALTVIFTLMCCVCRSPLPRSYGETALFEEEKKAIVTAQDEDEEKLPEPPITLQYQVVETELRQASSLSALASDDFGGVADDGALVNSVVIAVSEFELYVDVRKRKLGDAFPEFKALPGPDEERCSVARLHEKRPSHEQPHIVPYDETRVRLYCDDTYRPNDYINASFIQGYRSHKAAYIAAKSPNPYSTVQFWEMVWQYDVNVIVMVDKRMQGNRMLCEQYWPRGVGQTEPFGDYIVITQSVSARAEYVKRTMILSRLDDTRLVSQYQFTGWSSGGTPKNGPVALLDFHRRIHSSEQAARSPVLVHCRDGAGRTGMFIALDLLIHQAARDRVVDIYGCLVKLRQQRMLMVDNKEQYDFLHEAMLEHITVGNTSYPARTFASDLQRLWEGYDNGTSEVQRQFKILCQKKSQSAKKTQDSDTADESEKESTKWSLLHVDCFKKHNYYVVIGMPEKEAKVDFWQLVFNRRLGCIVMLNELDDTSRQYWPDIGSQTFGCLVVAHLKTSIISQSVVLREFIVDLAPTNALGEDKAPHASNPQPVKHYQLLNWPNAALLPPDSGAVLTALREVRNFRRLEKHREKLRKTGEVLLHCSDGRTRCGMFCAANHVIYQAKMTDEVNPLLAARSVAKTSPEFFREQKEYNFLFDIAAEYLSSEAVRSAAPQAETSEDFQLLDNENN